jgi:replicative DNA helicase
VPNIIFSTDQQTALLGYAITQERVYEAAVKFGISAPWFYGVNCKSVWEALTLFHGSMHRHPTLSELKSQPTFTSEEPKIRDARLKSIDEALAMRVEIGFDTLVTQIREWAKAQRFREGLEKSAGFYQKGDTTQAYKIYDETNLELQRIDQQGMAIRYQNAYERAKTERSARIEQVPNVLKYGVTYLDEATGGIGQNELVLLGAKTGVGKTQLITRIAATNANAGKRVAVFALEAEEAEIERRIKYTILARFYKNDNSVRVKKPIDYMTWRLGQAEKELGKYEDFALKLMEPLVNLNTLYRISGDYGISDLEKDIIRVAQDNDLIIIDHLHYVDLDGDNENLEMKKLVKRLRDLALGLSKPIIAVAHLKKSQKGKYAPLMPDIEDFHGSSDLIKIPTTAILLAPCYSAVWRDPRVADFSDTWPTFMKLVKCRMEGSRIRYTAIAMFDPMTGTYRNDYAIGQLNGGDCHWEPVTLETLPKKPYWAKSGNLILGEIE